MKNGEQKTMKKIGVVLTLILTSILGLVACNDPYKNMSLSLFSYDADLSQEVTLTLEEDENGNVVSNEIKVSAQISGAGKNISKELIIPNSTMHNGIVEIKDVKFDGKNTTTFTLVGIKVDKTTLEFKAEGDITKRITVNVEYGIKQMYFKNNIIPAIQEGKSYNLNQNTRSLITFMPEQTTQDKVKFEIVHSDESIEPNTYAYIEDGYIYTVANAVYPQYENGVKYITLRATSTVKSTIYSEIDIPIVSVTKNFSVVSSTDVAGLEFVDLTQNANGAYEMIMAPALSSAGDQSGQYFVGNRQISIQIGENKVEHDKYIITCNNENAEYLEVTPVSSVTGNVGGYRSDFANYLITAKKEMPTTKPLKLSFTVEYVGSTQENGGNADKFFGLFTQTINFEITITSVPTAQNITINDSTADDVTLNVYDVYKGSEGTYLKICNQFTAVKLTFSLKYEADGYNAGLGKDTLSVYSNGTFITDENHVFNNGDVIYLKHNYPILNSDYKPYLLVTFSYSFKPASAQEGSYKVYNVTKTINLNFSESVDAIELNNIALDITSSEYINLVVFPQEIVAEEYVRSITSSNSKFYEIAYDKNIVKIRANQNQLCGKATGFAIATVNGIVSNLVTVEAYLPTLYSTTSPLQMQVSGAEGSIFYMGADDSFSDQSGYVVQKINVNGLEYDVNTISVLALKTNSDISFNIYHLMIVNNNLVSVLPNYEVTITGTQSNVLTWNQESGTLSTYGTAGMYPITVNLTARTDNGSGTVSTINIERTINVYIFEEVTSAILKTAYKEVYIQNSINVLEQEADADKFDLEFVTSGLNGLVQYADRARLFGNVSYSTKITERVIKTYVIDGVAVPVTTSDIVLAGLHSELNEQQEVVNEYVRLMATLNSITSFSDGTYRDALSKKFENIKNAYGYSDEELWADLLGQGYVVNGYAIFAQFNNIIERPFSINVKYAEKVKRIVTNIDTHIGMNYEYKNGEFSQPQTINYSVFPSSAVNKDILIFVAKYNEDNTYSYIHASVNGKCLVCDCLFKEFGVCSLHDHDNEGDCTSKHLEISVNNGKITFNVKDTSLIGKLRVQLLPMDSFVATYQYDENGENRRLYKVENISKILDSRQCIFDIYVNNGSLAAPFQIRQASDFVTMLNDICSGRDGFNAFNYVQVNDINLSGVDLSRYYDGVYEGTYKGVFIDAGNNYKYTRILGVNLTGSGANMGLFATLKGTLQYVNVELATVCATGLTANSNIGVLAGTVYGGNIINCRVTSQSIEVSGASEGLELSVGGMVGVASNAQISGYYSYVSTNTNNGNKNSAVAIKLSAMDATTKISAGGIAGMITQTDIANLCAVPNIFFDASSAVCNATSSMGGLVGWAYNSAINNAEVNPALSGQYNVGGIVGYSEGLNLNRASVVMTYNNNMKNVISGRNYVGGLVGHIAGNAGTISYSYLQSLASLAIGAESQYLGSVVLINGNETEDTFVGGLFGKGDGSIVVNSSMFYGDITSYDINESNSNSYVNGIGYIDNQITLNDVIVYGRINTAQNSNTNTLNPYFALVNGTREGNVEEYNNAILNNGYVYVNNEFARFTTGSSIELGELPANFDLTDFAYTNGILANNQPNADGEFLDTLNNVMFTKQDESVTQVAKWFINNNINNNLPVLIVYDEMLQNFQALFCSIASIDAVVLEFQKSESIEVDSQGHIKVSDTDLILFYNQPLTSSNANNDIINKYSLRMEVNKDNDVIEVSFSAVDLFGENENGIVDINALKDYRIYFSSNILTYDQANNILTTNGLGTATLTFENIYDESNVITINIQIINGFTDFVVTDLADSVIDNETNFITVAVDNASSYKAVYKNVINNLEYKPYSGGYKVIFEKDSSSDDRDVKFLFNGERIDNDNNSFGKEFFTQNSSIDLVGVSAGSVVMTITPYVLYGDEKIYQEALEKEYRLSVNDKAVALNFRNEHSATIKPEGRVDNIYVDVITSNANELIKLNVDLTHAGQNTNIYSGPLANIEPETSNKNEPKNHLLVLLYEKESVSGPNDAGLYTITYKLTLKMDNVVYYNMFRQNAYVNPLEQPWVYNITLTTDTNALATDTYRFTIEGNTLDKIDTFLYPMQDDYTIDVDEPITTKLPAKSFGLLDITTIRNFNNVAYLEVTTNDSKNVTLKQLALNSTNGQSVEFSELENDAIIIKNGIRLWNVTTTGGALNFDGRFYVLLGTGENIAENSVLEVYINAYDYTGALLDNSRTFEIFIEALPKINVAINGEIKSTVAINEYYPISITTSNVDSELTWRIKNTSEKGIDPITGAEITSGFVNGVKLYTLENGVYTMVLDSKIDVSKQYYLGLSKNQYLTNLELVVEGSKFINGKSYTTTGRAAVTTVLATLEGVNVTRTESNNTFYLPTGTFSSLKATAILNESAMNVVMNYSLVDGNVYNNRGNDVTNILDAYYKNILQLYAQINDQLSGVSKVNLLTINQNGIVAQTDDKAVYDYYDNNWQIYSVDDKGEWAYSQLQNESYNSFRFFEEENENTHYYGVKALAIGSSQLRIEVKFGYSNGLLNLVDKDYQIYDDFTLNVIDNSTDDHPNPIYNQTDLEQVNADISSVDEDGNVIRPHYILMQDINLVNWKPIPFTAGSLDGNSYVINIISFDFSDYAESASVSAGLFTTISEQSTIKNVTINIAPLLVEKQSDLKIEEHNTPLDFTGKTSVNFGLISPNSEGVITNTKVVNIDYADPNDPTTLISKNSTDYILYVKTSNFVNGQDVYNYISPFVVNNSGSISYSYVGQNYATSGKTLKIATQDNNRVELENKEMYAFSVYTGNNVAGFVVNNNKLISNSYVYGVSIINTTGKAGGSALGGFVTNNYGTIYSCFIQAGNVEGYRATADSNILKSNGTIGGFVHTNGTSGVIENAYSVMNITTYSVHTGGFVYQNRGTIKTSYTTSMNKVNGSLTDAHSWFVSDKTDYGILDNCYYFVKNNELGLGGDEDYDDNILKTIDPATAIINKAENTNDNFSSKDSFDGFTFVTNSENIDGVWLSNQGLAPQINSACTDTQVVREMTGATDENGNEVPLEELENLEVQLTYNYTYAVNTIGSKLNPIVVSNAKEFVSKIIANSSPIEIGGVTYNIFGPSGQESDDSTLQSAKYVRLINDIDFSDFAMDEKYKMLNGINSCSLSQIVFNGYLVGNGMSIDSIRLNNTSEISVDDYGLFKQIGLTDSQRSSTNCDFEPVIFNLTLNYNEVKYKNARKVGVLAGSIYNSSILHVNLQGPNEDYFKENEDAVILGNNLVGGLAGFIGGAETRLSNINLSNIRVKVNTNKIANVADNYRNENGFYNSFIAADDSVTTSVVSAEFGSDGLTITNIDKISYGGALAGVINVPFVINDSENEAGETQVDSTTNAGKYGYKDYHVNNSDRFVTSIVVSNNLDIRADIAGGIVGGLFNTRLDNSTLLLKTDDAGIFIENNSTSYQSVFGYGYGGGIVGEMRNSILDQVQVTHNSDDQLAIDEAISKTESVSKSDLFVTQATGLANVSIAIGGLAGYSYDSAIVYSASKVNVQNAKAKLAGGLVGYAQNYNNISYSYATGNVLAKEIVGGLIGFYLHNGFDLYLFNTFGVNVWSQSIMESLKANSFAHYTADISASDITSIRMPEIGNSLAYTESYTENSSATQSLLTTTNDLSNANVANQSYKYIGSVLGKVSFGEGEYGDLSVSAEGRISWNDGKTGSVKNAFVYTNNHVLDKDNEYITSYDNAKKIIAVNLYYNAKDRNTWGKNNTIHTTQLTEILVRKDTVIRNDETVVVYEHKIYTNDYFFNVYSSVYSTITTTGSLDEANYSTLINAGSGTLITSPIETSSNGVIGNNGYSYDVSIGNQYYVSYITADYYVSNSGQENYIKFENAFATNSLVGMIFEPAGENSTFEVALYSENDPAAEIKGNSKASDIWFVNNGETFPVYSRGKVTNYQSLTGNGSDSDTEINTHEGLDKIFSRNSRGKVINLEQGNYNLLLNNTNTQQYKTVFRGTLNGLKDESGNNPVLKIYYKGNASSLFEEILDATFSNIDFKFIIDDNYTFTGENNYFGLLARQLRNTTFTNCNFNIVLKNEETTYMTLSNASKAGLVFGMASGSRFENCDFNINKGFNISNLPNTFGGFIGEAYGITVTNFEITMTDNLTVKSFANANEAYRLGGFAGYVCNLQGELNSTFTNINTSSYGTNAVLLTFGMDADVKVNTLNYGGYFGEIKDGTAINNVYLNKSINLNNSHITSAKEINVGGIVGSMDNGSVNNAMFGAYFNDKYVRTTPGFTITDNTGNNNNIGGLVGKMTNSSALGSTNGLTNINNSTISFNSSSTNTGEEVNIGGLVGYAQGSAITRGVNAKQIDVNYKNDSATCALGGIVGYTKDTTISYVNNYGDINLTNKDTEEQAVSAKNIYVGGVAGLAQLTNSATDVSISYATTYGDVYYSDTNCKMYLGGIIGYNSGTILYKLSNAITFTNFINLSTSNKVWENITVTPFGYFESEVKSLVINNENSSSKHIDASCMYVNELHLNLANSGTIYAPYGKWLVDLYNVEDNNKSNVLMADKYNFLAKTSTNSSESNDKIINELFVSTSDKQGKFNINVINTNISGTISGFNILNKNVELSGDITIEAGAVLTAKLGPNLTITLNGNKFKSNYGNIANIAIALGSSYTRNTGEATIISDEGDNTDINVATSFLDVNRGYIYNVVVYGEDSELLSDNQSGYVINNYGYISQSGLNVTYSKNLTENDTTQTSDDTTPKKFAGLAFNNYGSIINCYAIPNILYLDEYTNLTTVGIAYNNYGKIDQVFVGGSLKDDTIIANNKDNGVIGNALIDASAINTSSKYAVAFKDINDEDKIFANALTSYFDESNEVKEAKTQRIWNVNLNRSGHNYGINNAYPYIYNGIRVNTYHACNDNTYSFYSTKNNNVMVINTFRGLKIWSELNGASNMNVLITRDITGLLVESSSKEKGTIQTVSSLGKNYTFDGNGKTITGLNYSNSDYPYLIKENSGTIKEITLKDFTYKGSLANFASVSETSSGTISKVNAINSKEIKVTSASGGIAVYNTGTIENCTSNISINGGKVANYIGGISATATGTITDCTNTGNIEGNEYIGGIVGRGGSLTFTNNAVKKADAAENKTAITGNAYVGGLIGGKKDSSTITSEGNKVLNVTIYFGGFSEDANNGILGGKWQTVGVDSLEDVFKNNSMYRRDFKDENIGDNESWYGPTNGTSGNGLTESGFRFDLNNDAGVDQSVYYSTFPCENEQTPSLTPSNVGNVNSVNDFFSTAIGYNNATSIASVGLCYGYSQTDTKPEVENSTITKRDTNDADEKVVLDQFAHYAYIYIEHNTGSKVSCGLLVMQFTVYFDNTQQCPSQYSVAQVVADMEDSNKKAKASELFEINYAFCTRYAKWGGISEFNFYLDKFGEDEKCTYSAYSATCKNLSLSEFFGLNNCKRGIIYNFCKASQLFKDAKSAKEEDFIISRNILRYSYDDRFAINTAINISEIKLDYNSEEGNLIEDVISGTRYDEIITNNDVKITLSKYPEYNKYYDTNCIIGYHWGVGNIIAQQETLTFKITNFYISSDIETVYCIEFQPLPDETSEYTIIKTAKIYAKKDEEGNLQYKYSV